MLSQFISDLLCAQRLDYRARAATFALVLASVTLVVLSGCDQKPGVKASIAHLEKAFPPKAASTESGQPTANSYVQMALAAARTNNYSTAVAMLNAAVRAPGITPDQFLLVQQAKSALVTELQSRAEKGDASAQDAVRSIGEAHSR